nr:hypothetical protein [Clostridia bacterium]
MEIIELSDDFLVEKDEIMKKYNYPADYEMILKGKPIEEQLKHFKMLQEEEDKLYEINWEKHYDMKKWNGVSGILVKDGIVYGMRVRIPEYVGYSEEPLYVNGEYL